MKVIDTDVLILGGGIAGLIARHYFPNSVMVASSVGGQTIGPPFPLGPRFIHVGPNTASLVKDLGLIEALKRRVFIGYYYAGMLHKEVSKDMRKSYLLKTRGENAFLSKDIMTSGSNCFSSYDFPMSLVAARLMGTNKGNLIQGIITGIYEDYVRVAVRGEEGPIDYKVNYRKMISTIPRSIYSMLLFAPENILVKNGSEKLESISTTFYLIKVDAPFRKTFFNFGKRWLDYTYFPEPEVRFHRITRIRREGPHDAYLEGRMVLESTEENLDKGEISLSRNRMEVEDKFTLPNAQIINSLEREEIAEDQRVFHVGRYAEWCHSVKLEEVIERLRQIGRIIG